jgi:CheY-like chemotaxis protein
MYAVRVPTVLTGLRVLVVEDQDALRGFFEIVLRQCGAEVVSAATAQAGLDAFRNSAPDVLVTDLAMPERDGYWLIAQVRALRPRRVVPAIAVTGEGYEPARALTEGFHEYLTKPVDPDRLCDVVGRLASLIRPA